MVNNSISTVEKNLLEGALCTFCFNLLLGNIRAGLIVASVIPLCINSSHIDEYVWC
jgi:cobalt-zinc-cadmium resistance protein CzcA